MNRGGGAAADAPRRAAYDVLRAVDQRDAYANLTLPVVLRRRGLTKPDAALATELCYGTLRSLGTLDAILAGASHRPLHRIQAPVRDALRLGTYQLLYTRVPAHAAVDTTVRLLRAERGGRAAGFANAVLRRVAEHDLDAWIERVSPTGEYGRLSVRYAHPEWVVRAFSDALRGDLDEVRAALAADNERPPVHLVALPGRIATGELVEQADGRPGRYSRYAVYLPGGAPADVDAVARRQAAVQDEGSQLVALATAEAPLTGGPDRRWLDLCAGPGGKAALLGALAVERDAQLLAVEVSEHRARLVAEAVEGLPVRVVCADGRGVGQRPELPEGGFDRVLLDAPCSGLGALRRRPEARWRRRPEDLRGLITLQRELLDAGLRALRPGGVLGYVTCSPHPDETVRVVAEVTKRYDGELQKLDARVPLAGVPALGDSPEVQLWPHRHGTDAMFLALLRPQG